MYLRFGWVLGNVGPFWTVVIVTLATSVTFFTALSLSALATNMKVGGGGAYFIISRSLGLETGAAIGVPLFFAQAFGISFYMAGFAESLVKYITKQAPGLMNYIPSIASPEIVIGVAFLFVLAIIAYLSADLALKTQFIILALIIGSLLAFFAGDTPKGVVDPGAAAEGLSFFKSSKTIPDNFWYVFSIFFPAVTGIEAGLSMSGDLKDPAKSLPRGTLAAIGVSYVIYIAIPLFIGAVIPYATAAGHDILVNNSLIMMHISKWGMIVILAVWGASISSAMGAMLGAPRTLQALAKDSIIPRFIGRGFGESNNPRIATAITFILALGGIILGDLNKIAPILSMFFLTSYCVLNISSAFEGLIGSPSWRPAFRVHWSLSLTGALICIFVMIQINITATIAALIIASTIYYLVKRRRLMARWGDARYGILMLAAQNIVYRLAHKKADEKTWRPNILALSGPPQSNLCMLELANDISQQGGFLTVGTVITDTDIQQPGRTESIGDTIRSFLMKKDIPALVKVVYAKTRFEGAANLLQNYGFGPLVPNTILLGESGDKTKFSSYPEFIKLVADSQRNIAIVKEAEPGIWISREKKRIDLWWGGRTNSGALMIALAYLMRKDNEWSKAKLVLKTIVSKEEEKESAKIKIDNFIERSRLDAESSVIQKLNGTVFETIRESSKDADLVFLGIRAPGKDETIEEYKEYYSNLEEETKSMPLLIRTLAAEDVEFQRIFK
jgi:amino acid transporter